MLGQLATHWITLGNDQMPRWGEFDIRMRLESSVKAQLDPIPQKCSLRR